MKTMVRNIAVVAVAAVLMIVALAAFQSERSFAAKDYKYTVTVYSGEQGTFNGKKVWTKQCEEGELVTITFKKLGFKLKNKKYYARGFRITGHDNDETTGSQTMTFKVDSDVSYAVAYGIKGNLVSYTVKYLDKETDESLRSDDTFYGMPGDKPVVSFRYIDGYEPDTYNITKTLSKDESKNVMYFYYTKAGTGTNEEEGEGGNEGQDQGQGQGQGGNNPVPAGPAAPGTQNNPAGTNVNPNPGDNTNIDDGRTPTTNPGDNNGNNDGPTQIQDDDKPTASPDEEGAVNPALIAGGIGVAALLALLALLHFLKKKKSEANDTNAE
jgi:hypothetical protein